MERRLSLGCSAGVLLRPPPGSDGGPLPGWPRLPVLHGSAAQGRDDKNFAAAQGAKHGRRMARCVAGKGLLFGLPAAARRQLGWGRGIAAGWEQPEAVLSPAATASPLPLFCRVVGCKPPREACLKSDGAGWCVGPAGLPTSSLSPIGVPAEISHGVIFGYLDLKGQSLEHFGDT